MSESEQQLDSVAPVSGARVKLLSVDFGQPAFRKLKNQRVEIADRLTIIAGLNGVGKSSILAFIANGSGLTQPNSPRSYFDRKFQSHFHDILYLDYESEVDLPKSRDRAQVFLDFQIASGPFRRRASLSRRPSGGEDLARVVNRRVRGAEPPYYVKGQGLYRNSYEHYDHEDLAEKIQGSELIRSWMVSYDDARPIAQMYRGRRVLRYGLSYSAHRQYQGREIIAFSDDLRVFGRSYLPGESSRPRRLAPARLVYGSD